MAGRRRLLLLQAQFDSLVDASDRGKKCEMISSFQKTSCKIDMHFRNFLKTNYFRNIHLGDSEST